MACSTIIDAATDQQEEKMRRLLALILIIMVNITSINFSLAHGEEDFAKAEELIRQKISCGELTDEQLELIGEYYTEQMHPGELHEIMDEKMGGESSESLRQAHINMGLAFYCGEHGLMSSGMMNTMMGRGMMNGFSNIRSSSYYGAGMTGPGIFIGVIITLIIIILVLLIVWLMRQIQTPRRRR